MWEAIYKSVHVTIPNIQDTGENQKKEKLGSSLKGLIV